MKHLFDEAKILHPSIETHCGSPAIPLKIKDSVIISRNTFKNYQNIIVLHKIFNIILQEKFCEMGKSRHEVHFLVHNFAANKFNSNKQACTY